jgi:hypothetical protein
MHRFTFGMDGLPDNCMFWYKKYLQICAFIYIYIKLETKQNYY